MWLSSAYSWPLLEKWRILLYQWTKGRLILMRPNIGARPNISWPIGCWLTVDARWVGSLIRSLFTHFSAWTCVFDRPCVNGIVEAPHDVNQVLFCLPSCIEWFAISSSYLKEPCTSLESCREDVVFICIRSLSIKCCSSVSFPHRFWRSIKLLHSDR